MSRYTMRRIIYKAWIEVRKYCKFNPTIFVKRGIMYRIEKSIIIIILIIMIMTDNRWN